MTAPPPAGPPTRPAVPSPPHPGLLEPYRHRGRSLIRCLDELPAGQTGWLAGLRDEVVGRALALLHARPGDPWTLATLARETASSRSSLAKRFVLLVGQPPMPCLAQWRMQVVAAMLLQSGRKVATVGAEVGYDSEAACEADTWETVRLLAARCRIAAGQETAAG